MTTTAPVTRQRARDARAAVLAPGMIVSNHVPGHAGYRISDSMLGTDEASRPLTSYPRGIEDRAVAVRLSTSDRSGASNVH
ncbi:hypothetical protein [Saccharopolyspora sp. 5N708]|uniref:hypothetical protein n=1 Tax=Saccharopolyspora sp. 5N708 TaxID=3457424 RepID=UPI003FD0BF90